MYLPDRVWKSTYLREHIHAHCISGSGDEPDVQVTPGNATLQLLQTRKPGSRVECFRHVLESWFGLQPDQTFAVGRRKMNVYTLLQVIRQIIRSHRCRNFEIASTCLIMKLRTDGTKNFVDESTQTFPHERGRISKLGSILFHLENFNLKSKLKLV